MNFEQLIDSVTPDIYERLKTGLELGKWADGNKLTPEQKEHTMQVIIGYELKHLPPEERTGYVPPKPKKAEPCDKDDKPDVEMPLKWQD